MSGLDGLSIVSRRRMLKLGLGAGGLLLMGGGGLFALRGSAPGVAGLRILTGHEYRTLSRLAEVVVPGSLPLDLARAFDHFLADEPPWNIADLKRALFLIEFGPIVFDHRLTTFSNLAPDERLAHFKGWQVASLELRRVVSNAFRRFLLLVFYDQPSSWAQIGYDGPLIRPAEAK
ncbi:MAG: D-cysteine desulfhydrase [Myxococcaceae bacterium]|nr:D-cysteine desulfhydrase [Myxococcaceae bacterium]